MHRFLSLGLLTGILLGCGGGSDAKTLPTESVTGTVTYQGNPVKGATVLFNPVQSGEDHFVAMAQTDDQGEYSLVTAFGALTESSGAVAGEYVVTIVKAKVTAPAVGSQDSSPDPSAIAQQMGNTNKSRTSASSSAPRMGPMGRPASSATSGGLSQEDSEIPVKYATVINTPLKGVQVPGGSYDFSLVD